MKSLLSLLSNTHFIFTNTININVTATKTNETVSLLLLFDFILIDSIIPMTIMYS